eukprot:scaffold81635_cov30-Phaeocystis_antarctica.AAC.1
MPLAQADSAAKEEFKEVSARLTKAPCALVQPQWGVSPQMQRFMRAQAPLTMTDNSNAYPTPYPIPNPSSNPNRPTPNQAAAAGTDETDMGMASNLEINPKHPAVLKLKGMVEAERSSPATKVSESASQ